MGLVHISEIDRNYVRDVHDHLREGDKVEAKVVAIKDDGKIDLSIKQLQAPAPPPPRRGSDPAVRADAEEVHEAERRASRRLQARRRAQAEVAIRSLAVRPRPPTTGSSAAPISRRCASSSAANPTTSVHGGGPLHGRPSAGDPQRAVRRRGRAVPHHVLAHVSRGGQGGRARRVRRRRSRGSTIATTPTRLRRRRRRRARGLEADRAATMPDAARLGWRGRHAPGGEVPPCPLRVPPRRRRRPRRRVGRRTGRADPRRRSCRSGGGDRPGDELVPAVGGRAAGTGRRRAPTELARDMLITRLGQGVDATGRLDPRGARAHDRRARDVLPPCARARRRADPGRGDERGA